MGDWSNDMLHIPLQVSKGISGSKVHDIEFKRILRGMNVSSTDPPCYIIQVSKPQNFF